MKAKVTWRGWAGHFICAYMCNFRLNTLIEYNDIKIVVSTVGRMINQINEAKIKFEKLGLYPDRYFETLVFHAEKDEDEGHVFWDADVNRQIRLDLPSGIDDPCKENEANEMHQAHVDEIVRKLEAKQDI